MDGAVFDEVTVRVGSGRRILGPVSLRVGSGERWVLLGPNGSGKTTLLSLAGTWRHPSTGHVEILGERLGRVDVRRLRERIGHVGHSIADRMRFELTVRQVVLTGRASTLEIWLQELTDADADEASDLLGQMECAHLADQTFGECSQGERQRVLLARALFGRPEMLLLDEPAAGLDLPGREALVASMETIGDAVTTILATHHVEEMPSTTTHAALLRGGRLVAAGPVGDVLVDGWLSECFGLDVRVAHHESRWSAVARARAQSRSS